MKALPNGNFLIEQGTPLPYLCPQCKVPYEYEEGLTTIQCRDCGFTGTVADFSNFSWRFVNGEWVPVPKEVRQ
jgi:hypothetical protein